MPHTATPAKALVFYSHTPLRSTDQVPSVHELCMRGCSGQLMLEMGIDTTRRGNMIQLLGLGGCDSIQQMREQLVARFGKLKLGIVSEATEIQELATALGIPLFDTILQSLDHVDCLVVDSQWDVINDTLNTAIDTTPNLLKCVVMPATPIPRTIDSQWQSLVPQQSCMTKNGVLVDVSQSESLVCAYLHEGSTRRDNTTEFRAGLIQQQGCNGSILAWHYLAEIGQKLGYVPKYGA
ncbi:hypothetical protein O0I10_000856 [Lichtheimia ornata]|uniref:Uncharacterized protein n=1 Tax=Lichtheimia ornata TaxID=688661 RepID=A0AAD7Y4G2_9FUNG|nr:uncharacterized protein O0I10_000856 [Lichtheimia ornata]KAJ8663610.1 hypothetical protein O0I10_000856 [Lichtheimia ornata]